MIGPMRHRFAFVFSVSLALAGCDSVRGEPAVPEEGEVVETPFDVRGEAEGLLLVWFDAEGQHVASRRSEIPEDRRAVVRVDDLGLAPEQRLDPDLVYVVDLGEPIEGGRYTVRRIPRASFEARVEAMASTHAEAAPGAPAGATPTDGSEPSDADVVIYGASWCSACRSAAAFLRDRHIPFVERDVEREPGARQAMLRAAQAAGIRPSGIPVIDFRGDIIAGFDRGALERAIERTRTPI
jgi:glutaredoxin